MLPAGPKQQRRSSCRPTFVVPVAYDIDTDEDCAFQRDLDDARRTSQLPLRYKTPHRSLDNEFQALEPPAATDGKCAHQVPYNSDTDEDCAFHRDLYELTDDHYCTVLRTPTKKAGDVLRD